MKERPILMNGRSILSILERSKTQTRRPVEPQPPAGYELVGGGLSRFSHPPLAAVFAPKAMPNHREAVTVRCPYGIPGDRLWVRETLWRQYRENGFSGEHDTWVERTGNVIYCADGDEPRKDRYIKNHIPFWWEKKPSIHTFRDESRITLEVLRVWVEYLQDISDNDIVAEGAEQREDFVNLWNSIYANSEFSWSGNPLVWCTGFRLEWETE